MWAALGALGVLTFVLLVLYPAIAGVQYASEWLDGRGIPAALGFAVLVPGAVTGLVSVLLGRRRWIKVAGCLFSLLCLALLPAVW